MPDYETDDDGYHCEEDDCDDEVEYECSHCHRTFCEDHMVILL